MVLSPGVKCLESEGTSEFFYLPFFFIFLKLSVNLQEYSELPVAHLWKQDMFCASNSFSHQANGDIFGMQL